MIVVDGDTIAHLGGTRGDQVRLSRGGGPFELLVELGWDVRAQTTPQRRLLLAENTVFVLEPVEGPLLLPPFRVRRFDFAGNEVSREEGGGDAGDAELAYCARREGPARWKAVRCGVDPRTGRPTAAEETIAAELTRRDRWTECSGTPLVAAGVVWYPVRHRGLYGVAADGTVRHLECDPAPPQLLDGRFVCAASRKKRPGLWVEEKWHPLPGPPLFMEFRTPPGPLVIDHGHGYLALRREGGELPALSAKPVRIPEGIYSGLLRIGGHLHAVAEELSGPRLIAAEL